MSGEALMVQYTKSPRHRETRVSTSLTLAGHLHCRHRLLTDPSPPRTRLPSTACLCDLIQCRVDVTLLRVKRHDPTKAQCGGDGDPACEMNAGP